MKTNKSPKLPPTSVEFAYRSPDEYIHMLAGMGMGIDIMFEIFTVENLEDIIKEAEKVKQKAQNLLISKNATRRKHK